MILALLEGTALFVATFATIFLWSHYLLVDGFDVLALLGQTAILSLSCIIAFYYNDLYDLRVVRSLGEFATRLVQSLGVALILLAGFYAAFPDTRIAEKPFVSGLLMTVGVLLPLRAVGYAVMRTRAFAERVVILGSGPLTRKLIDEFESRPHVRYTIVAVADDVDGSDGHLGGYPLRGPISRLSKIVEEVRAERVIVALEDPERRIPTSELLEAVAHGVVVEDGVETYGHLTGKLAIEAAAPSSMVFFRSFQKSRLQLAVRRAVSLSVAAVALAATAPLMALIALAIKLDSPGPVFFVRARAGLGGRPFALVKFRTMREPTADTVGSVWHRDDRGRITRVGRWLRASRLDELPQCWNILRGDMDLVGPRPEILANVDAMTAAVPYYPLRHVVRPGLTGWAQVRYGYSVTLEQVTEKMRYDLYYVKHLSLWLDLRILVDTVKIVLFGRGAR